MSYNGSGTFTINSTGQPVVAGTVITASAFNALTADLATGLTTAITKDGQTTTTARITFAQGVTSSLVTDSSSVSTGSIITSGGVGIAKALYVGTTANVAGAVTLGGIATFSAQPIFSSLTASSAVATDASKGLVSVTNTGTGNNVLGTSPTITTPTISSLSSASATALTLQSAGTTAITVDTSQNVLVGTTTVNAKMTIFGGGASTSTLNLTGGSTGNDNATLSSDYNLTFQVDRGNNIGGRSFEFKYGGAGYSGGTSVLGFTKDKTLWLQGGSTSVSGTGITFPATQSASSDANTLDDYEEGTWTPTITFGNASTGITYSTNAGFYTKIGNQVFITGIIILSNKGSSTNFADIKSLPFTVQNTNGAGGGLACRIVNISFSGAFNGFSPINTTQISLSQVTLLGAVTDITDTNFSNNSGITFSINYRV